MTKRPDIRLLLAPALALWLAAATPSQAAQKTRPRGKPLPDDTPEWMIRFWDIVLARKVSSGGDSPLARSKSRLGWPWLAARHGIPLDGKLDRKAFRGPKDLFDRLDRDRDGVLDAADFDWSEKSPFLRQQALATGLFNRLNKDGDGSISAREWQEAFTKLAGSKGRLTPEDLRKMLFPDRARSMAPPTRWHRLLGFFSGELGSFHEGPNPGEPAPDFTLNTPDGRTGVKLSTYRNDKPVVLIFGNFT